MVRVERYMNMRGVLRALLVVVLSVIAAIVPHRALGVAAAAMEAVFYLYATGSLIAYMLQGWVGTTDGLFAAGATFTPWPGRSRTCTSNARPSCPGAESFAGVMYIALVVSRLISMTAVARRERH